MPNYLGHRPNRYTLVLTRAAAFTQRFENTDNVLPDGTTSWIDVYDTDDEILTTWHATTISADAVEYLIGPDYTDVIDTHTRATYYLYLNYPGTHLPYCWFRGPIVREQ
ncbi:LtfC-like domain-containing protein [Nocardia pseudovaccinii]|uniref:LtfC-like domain-containing protein n=1 Tax=Nocardia pseudovaccinii TaxID=189540 RepID=UPI0007A3A20A|nr:hypothetical protein [Nocardia pseudovaccinii]